jgi:hypothetical protein
MSKLMPTFKQRSPMLPNAFQRLRKLAAVKPRLVRFGATSVLIAILLTPSVWMLSTIPPLWSGVDAYAQVALPPGIGTILQYGPLYCFIARIPLYLGYALHSVRVGAPLPELGFFLHPALSDMGVFTLLLSQHAALCCSALYLIGVTSRLFLVRLVLAVIWAVNPLFYTLAHCVGSETLSMILLILLGATGLRIVRHRREIPTKEWLLFGSLLWLCILTRHINALLAALMPLTLLFLGGQRLIMIPFTGSQLLRRWRRLRARLDFRKAMVAMVIGLACLALANISVRGLCRAVRIPYEFRLGFTFMWRLRFLATISPETRNQLLENVARNTDSPEVKNVISLLRDTLQRSSEFDVMGFRRIAQASLFPSERASEDEKLIHVLNRTAWAFLCPPEKIFLGAVATDFVRSLNTTIARVANQRFGQTTWYFSHRDSMAGCGPLITFRDKSAAEILAIFKQHSYFRRRTNFSYNAFALLWLTALSLLAVLAKVRKQQVAPISCYATALTLVGLATTLATCLLDDFQPRFTLPMWELTILSASVLLGRVLECLFFFDTQASISRLHGAARPCFRMSDGRSLGLVSVGLYSQTTGASCGNVSAITTDRARTMRGSVLARGDPKTVRLVRGYGRFRVLV